MPTVTVDAILFNLDGTLVDSSAGTKRAWQTFARDYGLDAARTAHASRGQRVRDTLRDYCRIDDGDRLEAEVVRFEKEVIAGGSVVSPGALSLLQQIGAGREETTSAWSIVTSATNVYAPQALKQCGLPVPPLGLITSDDVANGKPHPAPYLAGARRLGVEPSRCVVVESAPSGIQAARTAGCKVIAVCTSHSRQAIWLSGMRPDYIVSDLTRISARWIGEMLELSIDESDS